MTVLVCGSREWDRRRAPIIARRLAALPPGTSVIHGAARGVDAMAGEIAAARGFAVTVYRADWSKGRRAGPIRNRQMLDQRPDLVLAFHHDLASSKGTADTVAEARRRGIAVEVIGDDDHRADDWQPAKPMTPVQLRRLRDSLAPASAFFVRIKRADGTIKPCDACLKEPARWVHTTKRTKERVYLCFGCGDH